MWRQGDVLIRKTNAIPVNAHRRSDLILAEGEATGHCHKVADPTTAELFEQGETLFLDVKAEKAIIVHDEHGPITLERGIYRVWRQREYTPRSSRDVRD